MANEEHLAILKQGVRAWNEWRNKNPNIRPNLEGADLSWADLCSVDLRSTNLRGADLRSAAFYRGNLSGADLSGANLSEADLMAAVLHSANLADATLNEVNLTEADLTAANLSRAALGFANLTEANVTEANLMDANLISAYLTGANLRGAKLSAARLSSANLTEADLYNADLTRSITWATVFANVDLSQVKGLDAVEHDGPSTVGIDTIYRSQGRIPETFLRGAGVPENFISYMRSLAVEAFEYYSCFISYSSNDQLFAERLYADLQAKGVRCWFAPHDVQGGKKLHEQIDQAIHVHERLLLILSPHSINSEWVKTEIAKARKREVREQRRMLFPVRLQISFEELQEWECFDADTGKDSAREIREYYIPDFTAWETPAHYKEEFDKLLRDLKRAESPAK